MRCLSVRQPWAELIASGRKTLEIRSWTTRYRGPLVICAAVGAPSRDRLPAWLDYDDVRRWPRGIAVALVALVDVRVVVRAVHRRARGEHEPLDGLVGAWAIGQHKEVNIGRFRNGKPDPGFWTRLAAVLEPKNAQPDSKADTETVASTAAPTDPLSGVVIANQIQHRAKGRGAFVKGWK
jgi:hypothetical protein